MWKVVLALFLFTNSTYAQINIKFENRSDYDTMQWRGDLEKFAFTDSALKSASMVQNDLFSITHPIDTPQQWIVDFELAHRTSSANYTDILLLCNEDNSQALYIRFGGSNDQILVLQSSNNVDSVLYEGPKKLTENSSWRLQVLRQHHTYHLRAYSQKRDTVIAAVFKCDLLHHSNQFCGFRIKQSTSSFFGKHYFYSLYAGNRIRDSLPPKLLQTEHNSNGFTLHFNEDISEETSSLQHFSNWETHFEQSSLKLISNSKLENKAYQFHLQIGDSSGNVLDSLLHLNVYIPDTPFLYDVVINEILFDPYPESEDFIELYNRSTKDLDLSTLQLCRYTKGIRTNCVQLSDSALAFRPDQYITVCADIVSLCQIYNCQHPNSLIQLKTPPMNNDQGIIILLSNNQVIDSLSYTKDMHLSLLDDTEGVSLERISPSAPSNQASNWRSASSIAKFATPGYVNSHYSETDFPNFKIMLNHQLISPNNDGFQDDLSIGYSLANDNYIANLYIFSLNGTLLHQPINMEHIPSEGQLRWDMVSSSGALMPEGHYVVFVEFIGLRSAVFKKKFAFSVASH